MKPRSNLEARAIALAILGAFLPVTVAAQRAAELADIPGRYPARDCKDASFPEALPPLDSVVDVTTLRAELAQLDVDRLVRLSLRLGSLSANPPVRILEKKVDDAEAERVVNAVSAALRDVPRGKDWALRLRVERDDDRPMALERSEVCGATPPARRLASATTTVRAGDLNNLRIQSRVNQQRRRMMVHALLINQQGKVLATELVSSSGDRGMDEDAGRAYAQMSFFPATLDGLPVSAWIELRGDYASRR